MQKLIILSNRQAVQQHIARLFVNTSWCVTGMNITKPVTMRGLNRRTVLLFHLDQFTQEREQLIEEFAFDWPVCVLGPVLTPLQFKRIWDYSIREYLLWDTPGFVLINKIDQIARQCTIATASTPKVVRSIQFDASQGIISTKHQVAHLSKLENELFSVLFAQHGSYVPRATLLDAIWPVGVFASNDALDVLVRRTRFKLAAINLEIRVKRGFGYQLVIQE